MELERFTEELGKLGADIRRLLQLSQYTDYNDLSGLHADRKNAEHLLLLSEYRGVCDRLEWINDTLEYLNRPIAETGVLHRNERKRYEIKGGREWSCGHIIEFLCNDDCHSYYNEETDDYENVPYWAVSSVEHNGDDYYIVRYPKIQIEGLTVRVRKAR